MGLLIPHSSDVWFWSESYILGQTIIQSSICLCSYQQYLFHIFSRLIEAQDRVAPCRHLLFAVTIEPLAIALRQNKKIAGIIRGGREHKVSLYADDLLLYISDQSKSLLHVLNV